MEVDSEEDFDGEEGNEDDDDDDDEEGEEGEGYDDEEDEDDDAHLDKPPSRGSRGDAEMRALTLETFAEWAKKAPVRSAALCVPRVLTWL